MIYHIQLVQNPDDTDVWQARCTEFPEHNGVGLSPDEAITYLLEDMFGGDDGAS